jgi:pyrroline-5-carboxylate reductase
MPQPTIGFIGAGNMARSIIGGLLAGGTPRTSLRAADPSASQRASLEKDFAVQVTNDNAAVAMDSDILVLAVKPEDLRAVARQIGTAVASRASLVISVAAGVRIDALCGWLGGYSTIVRTMPNRPALLRAGVTALYATPLVSTAQRAEAQRLMAAVGVTVWLEREELLDAVTAVSGSGPAYFFLLMELLESSARELGLPDETARTLAIETAYGAACLARQRPETTRVLREQVTSRGGTTAAALQVLEDADVRGIVSRAVEAACRRSAQLAAESALA